MSGLIVWFKSGGFPMWFILVFGLAGLVNAVRFAMAPSEGKLGVQRAVTWATVLTGVAGIVAGIATTCEAIATLPPDLAPQWRQLLLLGISESCTNLILGAALPGLSWFIVTFGLRRLDADATA